MCNFVWAVIVSAAVCSTLWGNGCCSPVIPKNPVPTDTVPRAPLDEYRLDGTVVPSHYDIEIKPYFEAEPNKEPFTFDGSTTITVKAVAAGTAKIKLHTASLSILAASVMLKSNSAPVQLFNQSYDEETEVLTLNLRSVLLTNVDYLVSFNYVGRMEENMRGFYRSYFTVDGTKVWLGSTQFEQMEARRAFPCFDEPKFKATFALKINYKSSSYKAYSNTAALSDDAVGNGRSLVTFATTPLMSTYLLAFIVAPYELYGDDPVRILARPQAANQTEYGAREGLKLLKQLGHWIDYPFDQVPQIQRMYMAAVPDFAAGAMENWGLVTYRESSLLYVPEEATSLQQQRIATIIAHELAHQWFGNLVTCEWWDVTWLNEGFASYLEYFGTAAAEPAWELDQQFVVEKLHSAMQTDGWTSTHPMTSAVYTKGQAAAIFDNISYNKGAVVLRMVEHFLSNAVFKTALREYVQERAFTAARPDHLFSVLNRHNPEAGGFMKPWTTQPGYPLVTVTGVPDGFTLTQARFLFNGTAGNSDDTTWPLPITYATTGKEFDYTRPRLIAGGKTFNIALPNASSVPYFIVNNQQIGYYRVNYDGELWRKISTALRSDRFGGIHVANRAQIVDDLFNLARVDAISYAMALDILEYLKKETEYLPWLAASNGLSTLSLKVHAEDEQLFTSHILDIFAEAYEHVKFQEPTSSERRVHTYLRRVVLDWSCRHGHETCSKMAVEEFERFRANPGTVKVHPDLRQVVYCEGVRRGSKEQFDFLLERYRTTNVATEQQLTLSGLSCATQDGLVQQFMDLTSSADVRSQDKATALSLLLGNPQALESAASYLITNHRRWSEAHDGYGSVGVAFKGILGRLKNPLVRDSIRAFAEGNKEVLGSATYAVIVDGLAEYDANLLFTVNHRDDIRGFLKAKAHSGATSAQVAAINMMTVSLGLTLWALRRW
ncbi:membrane alanyl aminopeptidase-like [Anopheles bellator]|uniref:membrane alanyl aminopeptidase-like n=1 Tax=Anopheles bellator TaxID=139047 RepID=UPI002648268A|nr:membrane alanyl aminopeptidase-like [Anopheles bellator]